jgi:hypothetical protein
MEDIKEQKKEDISKNVSEDISKNITQDISEDTNETIETKIEKTGDCSYIQMIIDAHKLLCMQVITMLLISLIYINCYDNNIYDFIIYFCFGIVISILFVASLVLIKKFNIISKEEHYKIYAPYVLDFCKKYIIDISGENIAFYYAIISCLVHLIFSIIALLYVKKYIKTSKKTNNALLISFILFIIYGYVNVYVNDIFKIYTKSLELTNREYVISLSSITLTYSGLIYYIETIKNERTKLINKLIN